MRQMRFQNSFLLFVNVCCQITYYNCISFFPYEFSKGTDRSEDILTNHFPFPNQPKEEFTIPPNQPKEEFTSPPNQPKEEFPIPPNQKQISNYKTNNDSIL